VVGSRLRRALDAITHAARTGSTLVIQGESGAGKEVAARTFHAQGPHARGPFVGVNCAAIPEGLAERLLFGAKRGAYSGAATNAVGHVQAAHGGVLFLDEIGDLDAHVQAKLLRALETREVVPLGDSIGQPVDVRVCVATQKPLRAIVAEGRFRADLYYRLAPPEVALPPLRERLDEIPRHLALEIASVSPALSPHVRLVEGCMLKAWPGNVRELRKEAHHAATRALADGSERVRFEHLSETAGCAFRPPEHAAETRDAPSSLPAREGKRSYIRRGETFTREHIERAILEAAGNVATASRALGIHRAQLYREMARFNVPMPQRASRD
jgi:transcriptional regulator with PAS, ATPase and Fis domain